MCFFSSWNFLFYFCSRIGICVFCSVLEEFGNFLEVVNEYAIDSYRDWNLSVGLPVVNRTKLDITFVGPGSNKEGPGCLAHKNTLSARKKIVFPGDRLDGSSGKIEIQDSSCWGKKNCIVRMFALVDCLMYSFEFAVGLYTSFRFYVSLHFFLNGIYDPHSNAQIRIGHLNVSLFWWFHIGRFLSKNAKVSQSCTRTGYESSRVSHSLGKDLEFKRSFLAVFDFDFYIDSLFKPQVPPQFSQQGAKHDCNRRNTMGRIPTFIQIVVLHLYKFV